VTLRPVTDDGYELETGSELQLVVHLDLYETDPDGRTALVAMVEDALLPVNWMYGARLELGHYFGMHADYALESVTYIDSAQSAKERLRIAHLEVSASVPVVRAVKLPENQTRLRTSVGVGQSLGDPNSGVVVVDSVSKNVVRRGR